MEGKTTSCCKVYLMTSVYFERLQKDARYARGKVKRCLQKERLKMMINPTTSFFYEMADFGHVSTN